MTYVTVDLMTNNGAWGLGILEFGMVIDHEHTYKFGTESANKTWRPRRESSSLISN
jgi:hypothetical protein